MTDTAKARCIIDDIWPIAQHGRSRVIALAYDAIKDVERAIPQDAFRQRRRQWTERRMRSIVDQEAPRIDAYEMSDLETMRLREARNEYRKSVERAARLATLLETKDEDFHGPEIDFYREQLGRLDRARSGDETGS